VSMAGGCAGGAACLSRVPFLAGRLLAAPAWLDGARAGVAFRRGRADVRLDGGGR